MKTLNITIIDGDMKNFYIIDILKITYINIGFINEITIKIEDLTIQGFAHESDVFENLLRLIQYRDARNMEICLYLHMDDYLDAQKSARNAIGSNKT